ncbi:MAG: hypothetical protein NUV75_00150 [Gallionella sp.]|nr:hypothetical protein [Gallionella sp.]
MQVIESLLQRDDGNMKDVLIVWEMKSGCHSATAYLRILLRELFMESPYKGKTGLRRLWNAFG